MTAGLIWIIATLVYLVFLLWYVGMRPKVTMAEVDATLALLDSSEDFSQSQRDAVRHFLKNDDGKDFVMVNLLELKSPLAESRDKLAQYQKVFLGNLLKRAGHPVFIARAASANIENVNCDSDDNWTAAGMIRYRSRRDFMEIIPETVGSKHHNLKLESLEKTFAYPGSPWSIIGGLKLLVPMAIALSAAIAHIMFV